MKKSVYYLVLLLLWLLELIILSPLAEDNLLAGIGLFVGMCLTFFIWDKIFKHLKF